MTPAARKARFDRLVEIGCIACLRDPDLGFWVEPEIHHLKGHPYSSMGKRAADEYTIPLCAIHHRHGAWGHPGYHQSPRAFERKYGTQAELLAAVEAML
jgi:hypothetical protein